MLVPIFILNDYMIVQNDPNQSPQQPSKPPKPHAYAWCC